MTTVEEFERKKELLEAYERELLGYRAALTDAGESIHFIPTLAPSGSDQGVVITVVNFKNPDDVRRVPLGPVTSAFFYEAYRRALADILEDAAEHAHREAAEQLKAVLKEISAEKSRLSELESALKKKVAK